MHPNSFFMEKGMHHCSWKKECISVYVHPNPSGPEKCLKLWPKTQQLTHFVHVVHPFPPNPLAEIWHTQHEEIASVAVADLRLCFYMAREWGGGRVSITRTTGIRKTMAQTCVSARK